MSRRAGHLRTPILGGGGGWREWDRRRGTLWWGELGTGRPAREAVPLQRGKRENGKKLGHIKRHIHPAPSSRHSPAPLFPERPPPSPSTPTSPIPPLP